MQVNNTELHNGASTPAEMQVGEANTRTMLSQYHERNKVNPIHLHQQLCYGKGRTQVMMNNNNTTSTKQGRGVHLAWIPANM